MCACVYVCLIFIFYCRPYLILNGYLQGRSFEDNQTNYIPSVNVRAYARALICAFVGTCVRACSRVTVFSPYLVMSFIYTHSLTKHISVTYCESLDVYAVIRTIRVAVCSCRRCTPSILSPRPLGPDLVYSRRCLFQSRKERP